MEDEVARTIRVYERDAETYAATHLCIKGIQLYANAFLSQLEGKGILDVGCGPGRDAKYFSEKGFNVVGIDLTDAFIGIAKKNAPCAQFARMDMRRLALADESLDGIWAAASLLHIPKREAPAVLDEFYRVLVPRGRTCIIVKDGIGERMVAQEQHSGSEKFYAYYLQHELSSLVESSGFAVTECLSFTSPRLKETWMHIYATKNKS